MNSTATTSTTKPTPGFSPSSHPLPPTPPAASGVRSTLPSNSASRLSTHYINRSGVFSETSTTSLTSHCPASPSNSPSLLHMDLLKATINSRLLEINHQSSILYLINIAEKLLIDCHNILNFKRRPDLAYVEFVIACDLVVSKIPLHHDYSTLEKEGGIGNRKYTDLLKRIQAEEPLFMKIKDSLKEVTNDSTPQKCNWECNARSSLVSGAWTDSTVNESPQSERHYPLDTSFIQPQPHTEQQQIHQSPQGSSSRPNSSTLTSPRPKPPPIRPKPISLHSRLLNDSGAKPVLENLSSLNQRFARLRTSNVSSASSTGGVSSALCSTTTTETDLSSHSGSFSRKKAAFSAARLIGVGSGGNSGVAGTGTSSSPGSSSGIVTGTGSNTGTGNNISGAQSGKSTTLLSIKRASTPTISSPALLPKEPSPIYVPSHVSPGMKGKSSLPHVSSRNSLSLDSSKSLATSSVTLSHATTTTTGTPIASTTLSSLGSSTSLATTATTATATINSGSGSGTITTCSGSVKDDGIGENFPGKPKRNTTWDSELSINAKKLYDYLQLYTVLLLDVRNRKNFDEGHILSSSVVCIEPSSLRKGMSADQIQDTLVVSPDIEQTMFSRRNTYQLVVYYDSNTKSTRFSNKSSVGDLTTAELRLGILFDSLVDFNHDKPLQKAPVLLEGGIQAWINLLGVQALRSSPSYQVDSSPTKLSTRITSVAETASLLIKKKRREFNPLDPEEERKWQERARSESIVIPVNGGGIAGPGPGPGPGNANSGGSLGSTSSTAASMVGLMRMGNSGEVSVRDELTEGNDDQVGSVVQTTEEFLRRFPPALEIEKQSILNSNNNVNGNGMGSGLTGDNSKLNLLIPDYHNSVQLSYQQQAQQQHHIISGLMVPSPPSRPPRAASSVAYSGVVEKPGNGGNGDLQTISTMDRSSCIMARPFTNNFSSHGIRLPRTGLINFGVTCYMNSIVQCLSGTLRLSAMFRDRTYRKYIQRDNWKGSKGLIPEHFANLIQHLWKGDVSQVKPATFRGFCTRLNSEWGSDTQQDAKEFFDFLIDYLHEDLNQNWNNPPPHVLSAQEEAKRERMSRTFASKIEWARYVKRDESFISHLFAGQHSSRLRCTTCQCTSTTYEPYFSISVEIPRSGSSTLHECLRSYCAEERLSGDEVWFCPNCKKQREATKQITLTRAPEILVIHLKRFSAGHAESARKVRTPIQFPLYGLDIGEFMLPMPTDDETRRNAQDRGPQDCTLPPSMTPPYIYNAYAVIRHFGNTLSSGHYTALVKDPGRGIWREFNDAKYHDFDYDVMNDVKKILGESAYLVFYERAPSR